MSAGHDRGVAVEPVEHATDQLLVEKIVLGHEDFQPVGDGVGRLRRWRASAREPWPEDTPGSWRRKWCLVRRRFQTGYHREEFAEIAYDGQAQPVPPYLRVSEESAWLKG